MRTRHHTMTKADKVMSFPRIAVNPNKKTAKCNSRYARCVGFMLFDYGCRIMDSRLKAILNFESLIHNHVTRLSFLFYVKLVIAVSYTHLTLPTTPYV